MIRSDNHLHTDFSSDSSSPMEDMLSEVRRLGLSGVCITDHMDYDFIDLENGMDFLFDPEAYWDEITRLTPLFPELLIRRGVELGLQPHIGQSCHSLAVSCPFDFIIGSTHLVDRMDPYYPEYWEDRTEQDGILRYYETTLENIEAISDFDVYGHIDYIVRYTPTQQEHRKQGFMDEAYMKKCYQISSDLIDEILRRLIHAGKGIECNTAGLKYGLGHPHPHEAVLKRYHELGGEILTIGSDAHEPAHIAYDFDIIEELLKSCGFRYYTEFHGRKPQMLPIS